jgi:thymidylate kinase
MNNSNMKQNNFFSSDVSILLKLFIPKTHHTSLFDSELKRIVKDDSNPKHQEPQKEDSEHVLLNFSKALGKDEKKTLHHFNYILDFSNRINNPHFKKQQFHYITNPDGTIRWLYPASLPAPTFLNFYSATSLKAKIYCNLVRLLFKLHLQMFINSGRFSICYKNEVRTDDLLNEIPHDSYSIFTGTIGENRKAILEINKKGISTHFVKIALNDNSCTLINNERNTLEWLCKEKMNYIETPQLSFFKDRSLCIQSNIKNDQSFQSTNLSEVHYKALIEFYSNHIHSGCLHQSITGKIILENSKALESAKRFNESSSIAQNLTNVYRSISDSDHAIFSRAHMDFTPWNMYVSSGVLQVYDWELFQPEAPIFFDLYHYIFQSAILIKKKKYSYIKEEIEKAYSHPIIQSFMQKHTIDGRLQLKLYVLWVVAYYVTLYEKQPVLHAQAYWLVKIWNEALAEMAMENESKSHRKIFISDFFKQLNRTNYAALKFQEENPERISDSSDLDILILKEDLKPMISYCNSQPIVRKLKCIQKSFMTTLELYFMDDSYLSVDLLYQFKRKAINMMDAKKVLISASKNSFGITVPDMRFDFEYAFLFFMLNQSSFPEKYKYYFGQQPKNKTEKIKQFIQSVYGIEVNTFEDLFHYSDEKVRAITNELNKRNENKGLKYVMNVGHYVLDTCMDVVKRKGIIISFSGVDGAGKSTIIEKVVENLSVQYRRKVIVLRHRPSVFPILSSMIHGKEQAQKLAAERLPRQGKNDSLLSSFMRFAYYFLDYMIGQPVVYVKYILRGYIVLYDRYYFDFIVDAKRSNIKMSPTLIKFLYRFIIKPEINIFLYASPDVILSRKKELDAMAIMGMTNSYKNLFLEYNKQYQHNTYLQIENIDFNTTLKLVLSEYSSVA